MNFVRALFCIYNFIFLVIGAIVLGFGIWIVADQRFAEHLQKLVETANKEKVSDSIIGMVKYSGYILMSFGGVIFFLSFLGYCGAIKQSRFLLGFYTLLLGLILILEVAALVLILAIFGPKFEVETKKFLTDELKLKYVYPDSTSTTGKDATFSRSLDVIMVKFQCCGISNYSDFVGVETPPTAPPGTRVPKTCCKCKDENQCKQLPEFPTQEQIQNVDFQQCEDNPQSPNANNAGCYAKLKDKLLSTERMATLIGVGIIIALLQLIGVIFGCYTYKKSFSS